MTIMFVALTVVLAMLALVLWREARQSCRDCEKWQALYAEVLKCQSEWEALKDHPVLETMPKPKRRGARKRKSD